MTAGQAGAPARMKSDRPAQAEHHATISVQRFFLAGQAAALRGRRAEPLMICRWDRRLSALREEVSVKLVCLLVTSIVRI
jgi:hypothetical protein